MSTLERIKEIETIKPGDVFPLRWCDDNLRGSPRLMHDDISFLLRAFQVMREMLIVVNREMTDRVFGDSYFENVDQEFEERMKG